MRPAKFENNADRNPAISRTTHFTFLDNALDDLRGLYAIEGLEVWEVPGEVPLE